MEKIINNEHLSNIKFAADCAIKDPDSIYSQEFFMLLDETFGSSGDYESPTQAVAVVWLINRVNDLEKRAEENQEVIEEYNAAMCASKEAGYAGVTAAQAIHYLMQRAESADAKLAELEKQEHYVEVMKDGPMTICHWMKSAEELPDGARLFTRAAPAADLADLVPDELTREAWRQLFINDDYQDTFRCGFSACRAAILRKIEDTK